MRICPFSTDMTIKSKMFIRQEFFMQSIEIIKTTTPKQKPDDSKLGFGKHFTDHMFVMEYSPDLGWHDAKIIPFGNLTLHPASTVLHYGAEIFEGLKAYRTPDGSVQLFRPTENIARLNSSADRICLPQVDPDFILEALKKFVEVGQLRITISAPSTHWKRLIALFVITPLKSTPSIVTLRGATV